MSVFDEGWSAFRKVVEDREALLINARQAAEDMAGTYQTALTNTQATLAAAQGEVAELRTRLKELETPTDPGFLTGWGVPVWRDEFDSPTLDLTKWNVRDSGHEAQDTDGYFEADMAFVRDGQLVMRTQRMATPKTFKLSNGSTKTAYYATCYLDTIGKFSQRYGRWEIRLKALEPGRSRGIWPAFWLRDDKGGGENDIYEAVGTPCAHPNEYPPDGSGVSQTMYQNTGKKVAGQYSGVNIFRLGAPIYDFHTYACEWTPEGMTNYIDGVATLKVSGQWLKDGFTSAANIRLDKFVGTPWAGRPNETQTAAVDEMLVDYVRVWKYTA